MYHKFILVIWCAYLWWSILAFGQNTTTPEETTSESQSSEPNSSSSKYCENGIKLNTNFPFIGNCIQLTKEGDAVVQTTVSWSAMSIVREDSIFPFLLTALSKIVMSVILLACFVLLIIWWYELITGQSIGSIGSGMDKVKIVISVLALLGMASVILKVVNPNFFGDG
jgi:hypothetical protein